MFNWLSGRGKTNTPEPTALQVQRTKQIEQLRVCNQNVSEIHRDLEYRVNTVIHNTTLSLLVTLPPQFPQEKPTVRVTPAVRHPWIDDQMFVTGSQSLEKFVVSTDLGQVIKEIVEEFHRNPPTVISQAMYNYTGYPFQSSNANPSGALPSTLGNASSVTTGVPGPPPYPPSTWAPAMSHPSIAAPAIPTNNTYGLPQIPMPSLSTNTSHVSQLPTTTQQATDTQGTYRMPELPHSFSQLQDLSMSELQELEGDEDKLLEMLLKQPQLQQISDDRDRLVELNECLAKHNLSMKPVIEERKRILIEKYDLLNDVKQHFDAESASQDAFHQQRQPAVLQDCLRMAAAKAEEEAENLADKFLEGHIPVEDFKKQFLERRKLGHLRKAKEEGLVQIMQQDMAY